MAGPAKSVQRKIQARACSPGAGALGTLMIVSCVCRGNLLGRAAAVRVHAISALVELKVIPDGEAWSGLV